jgi:hypothetical protein
MGLNMSNEEDKFKHSKRLQKEGNAIKKQAKIAKDHGISEKETHRFSKHHAMNCGNLECLLCSNPRKISGEKTIQEQRFEQRDLYDELGENE